MTKQDIENYAKSRGYDYVEDGGKWKDYDVYRPRYKGNEIRYVGYPLVILVKDEEIRMSTKVECFEYLDYFAQKNRQKKI